jgi:hypothetical protein
MAIKFYLPSARVYVQQTLYDMFLATCFWTASIAIIKPGFHMVVTVVKIYFVFNV